MTAFTYRFAPSMRYLKHLILSGALGTPRHFRSQRFLDLPETSWGWRQLKKRAGAGDLFDMTIHRIDFAQDLMGPIESLCGAVAQFVPRDRTADGKPCEPSDVDDWSALIGRFQGGAVGVWEGSTLMKGHYNDGFGFEWAEVNGSDASAVYRLTEPNTILVGRHNESLQTVPVPAEFLVAKGSPRIPRDGVPSTVFRYDLVWEFVSAITEGRDAVPGFDAGAVPSSSRTKCSNRSSSKNGCGSNRGLGRKPDEGRAVVGRVSLPRRLFAARLPRFVQLEPRLEGRLGFCGGRLDGLFLPLDRIREVAALRVGAPRLSSAFASFQPVSSHCFVAISTAWRPLRYLASVQVASSHAKFP